MKNHKNQIGFFGKLEDEGNDIVRYSFAGVMDIDGEVTGTGDGYVGGGCTDSFFVYKDTVIPGTTEDDCCLEHDELEAIFLFLTGKELGLAMYEVAGTYAPYKEDKGFVTTDPELLEQGWTQKKGLKPVSYGCTGWEEEYGIPSDQSERFDCIEDFFEYFEIEFEFDEDCMLNVESLDNRPTLQLPGGVD